ncbi:MAG TPA: response regulator [Candidatus Acidoferrum sp.]
MPRILVVEDNAINRELLCDWLEAQDYEVLSAEDLGGAQRLLQSEQPDAVLLDVQLGGEDGLSLAVWMRRQPEFSGIPVIAVTAHAMVTEQQRFLQAGCNACISKPVDFKLLSRELDKWLAPLQNRHSRV